MSRLGDWLVHFQRVTLGGLSTGGIIAALFGLFVSLSPSLLPRPWIFQGLISGLMLAAFYPIGVLIQWILSKIATAIEFEYSISAKARRFFTIAWQVLALVAYLGAQAVSLYWQQESAALVGAPRPTGWYTLGSIVVTTATFGLILLIYRGVHWAVNRTDKLGRKMLPATVSRLVATAIVLLLVLFLIDRVLLANIMDVAEQNSLAKNATTPEGYSAPSSELRSGGPGSAESWESLGAEGAQFVASGPDAEKISEVTGEPALEPIRVYAGLGERSLQEVTDAVLAEMDRTGAFERSAILLYTTTGTGWVNEWHPAAFEYLQNGDTAVAAMQYSNLPSPLALLTDTETPRAAGRLLYEAVSDRIAQLPEAERPKLYLAGESLGAFGSQETFTSKEDLLDSVDGAVWTGTPGFTPLRLKIADERNPGSTEVNAVIDNGAHIRFAENVAELSADQFGRPLGPWEPSRVVYLQHASDPVAWWSMDLAFNEPDWMQETPGADVTGRMRFVPIATLLQVSADMAVATNLDPGHGHVYHDDVVPAWAGVLGDDPEADYSAIIDAISGT